MASLVNEKSGLRRVIATIDGKRQSIRISRIPLRAAQVIVRHVESLITAHETGTDPDVHTVA